MPGQLLYMSSVTLSSKANLFWIFLGLREFHKNVLGSIHIAVKFSISMLPFIVTAQQQPQPQQQHNHNCSWVETK